jgi:hypothetical protein
MYLIVSILDCERIVGISDAVEDGDRRRGRDLEIVEGGLIG